MTQALNENTAALNRVNRNYHLVWAAFAIMVLMICMYIYRTHDLRVNACKRDNKTRQANLDLWRPVLLQPVDPLPENATDAEKKKFAQQQEIRKTFEFTLNEGFKLRNCGNQPWF